MTSPNLEPSLPPAPKSSGSVWKWIGIGCAGLLVLGIAGIAGLVVVAQRSLKMSFDGGQADEVARTIIDYEIPGGGQGFMSMDMGMFKMAGVMSREDPEGLLLIVGEMSGPMMEQDPERLKESMLESMGDQNGPMTVESQRSESRELCGQTVQIEVFEGRQRVGLQTEPALVHQVFLIHNGEGVLINLTTVGSDAQAKAEAVLGSIGCK